MATFVYNNITYMSSAVVVIEMASGDVHRFPATIGVNDNNQLVVVSGGPQGQAPDRSVTVEVQRVMQINAPMRNGVISV